VAGPTGFVADPEPDETAWFKTAVFYEVFVQAFRDSNRDGTGDLRGPPAALGNSGRLFGSTGIDAPLLELMINRTSVHRSDCSHNSAICLTASAG
jgi:hypothetical protein